MCIPSITTQVWATTCKTMGGLKKNTVWICDDDVTHCMLPSKAGLCMNFSSLSCTVDFGMFDQCTGPKTSVIHVKFWQNHMIRFRYSGTNLQYLF